MPLFFCPKVKVKMYSKGHVISVLLIVLASLSKLSLSSNPEDPLVLDHHHHHHQSNTFGHDVRGPYPTISRTRKRSTPRAAQLHHYLSTSAKIVVNVEDFGAEGNGGDDTQAFRTAWREACSSRKGVHVDLVVPKYRTYHLKPITFSGPCTSSLTLKIYGTINAFPKRSDYKGRHWILFENLQNFRVEGGGTLNGNGRIWWQNSCKVNQSLPCKEAPTAVTFLNCNTLEVANLMFKNAQQIHVSFDTCVNVKALNLAVTAPEDSPNTDGIHVTATQYILIKDSVIRTGDDCISIVSGSQKVRATNIVCGPGHGISIGSLGAENSEAQVSDVVVSKSTIIGTTNGLRIKTWQGGSGYAKNILFTNVMMYNVSNPIIIDQHYCDQKEPCLEQASAVKISNVEYHNIRGTSASEVAVKFDCSKRFRCEDIVLQEVNLVAVGEETKAIASCENVAVSHKGRVSPQCSPLI